VPKCVD
jgi:hypothetical protein